MGMLTVPTDVISRLLGGEATRDVLAQCTAGPVMAKRDSGKSGVFLFPLVHPKVVRHADALGISPHIEPEATLYLERTEDDRLHYVVAVGENRAVVGYGEFERVVGAAHLTVTSRLNIQYAYEAGSIRVFHIEDGLKGAHTPLHVIEIGEEQLEQLVRRYAVPKYVPSTPVVRGVSDEEVERRIAQAMEELRKRLMKGEEKNKDLEGRLAKADAELRESKRQLGLLQQGYERADRGLTAERAARQELEGKLAEERRKYTSLEATHKDLLARKFGSGTPGPAPYPPEITSEKDRFLYDLAKSLMKRCVEQKRYKADDTVGLGWNDDLLQHRVWHGSFNFYKIEREELAIIATTNPAMNADVIGAIRVTYYNASKNLADLFPELAMRKIPAYVVLFLQLMSFGKGPMKSPERISTQLGFTPEQISAALKQKLLRGTENGIKRITINETMHQVYPLFMRYRRELYEQCTATPTLP